MQFLRCLCRAIFAPEKKLVFPQKKFILAFAIFLIIPSIFLPFALLPLQLAITITVVCLFASVLALIFFVELWFRISHKKVYGYTYKMKPNYPDLAKLFFVPHPYIPYVLREDLFEDKKIIKRKFGRTLGIGVARRKISMPKPESLIRINCLGASTTAFHEEIDGKLTSYPIELEKILKTKLPDLKIEVNNCGVPGYTSAEICVEFLLRQFDTQPDIVVIYHGHNDIYPYLTSGFRSDYSHCRRNLAEIYERMRICNLLPDFPLNSYNFLLRNALPPTELIENDLHYAVTNQDWDFKREPVGLETYRRNIEHILNVCNYHCIMPILSTFCHFLEKDIGGDEVTRKGNIEIDKIIAFENSIMRALAETWNIPLVDNAFSVPKEEKFFKDRVHFSALGMKTIAKNISIPVIKHLKEKYEQKI